MEQTFYNQALNTLMNYGCRSTEVLNTIVCADLKSSAVTGPFRVEVVPAQYLAVNCDAWITDPGYADAINYEEISEFFLAAYGDRLIRVCPSWYDDSKRKLAVKGTGESFRVTLAECYKRMAQHMLNDGYQVVMFTHQDPAI